MSTTSDLAVAVSYGLSCGSLLFKIVARNIVQQGVNLQWLSAFPTEVEFCFPPLTYVSRAAPVEPSPLALHVLYAKHVQLAHRPNVPPRLVAASTDWPHPRCKGRWEAFPYC